MNTCCLSCMAHGKVRPATALGAIVRLCVNCLIFCLSLVLSHNLLSAAPMIASETIYTYEVIPERPHHSRFFTQGLKLHNSRFYESSGLYNQSFIPRFPIDTTDED